MMYFNEITKGGKDYVGYDYKTITTDSDKVSLYLDAYENFGWIADGAMPARQLTSTITLKLKRDRKILNKVELTRLQQHFEACMDEITALELTKTKTATNYSVVIGIAGTAFLAGSVFAVTHVPPNIFLCVVLGIPGLIGWVLPIKLFKFFLNKRDAEVSPIIEKKYDEIHDICEKGNALIH